MHGNIDAKPDRRNKVELIRGKILGRKKGE